MDAGLTVQDEMRSAFECLDQFSLELKACSEAMDNILSIFAVIQPSLLLSAKRGIISGEYFKHDQDS